MPACFTPGTFSMPRASAASSRPLPGAGSASSSDKVELLRILLIAEVERELLDTIRVLLPPELDKRRRQDGQDDAQAMDAAGLGNQSALMKRVFYAQ
jgi:hypothetical protein